jgi:hypothetical protein
MKHCGCNKRIEKEINRIENPEINPHTYSKLIFDKRTKKITMEQRHSFQKMVQEQLAIHM